MSEPLVIISQPLNGVSFGLEFTSQADRFGHQVFARSDSWESDLVLYNSIEGDEHSNWPPSPPLQDVHQQVIGDQAVVMAVGMAGASHWSAACSLRENDQRIGFHFDIACRIKNEPDWLGSTYLRPNNEAESKHPNSALSDFDVQVLAIEVDGSAAKISEGGQQLVITAGPESGEEKPQIAGSLKSPSRTIRWQYLLEFIEK
jgi:hypothetical protein